MKFLSPKALLGGITGITGVVAPSAIAGEKSIQVNSLIENIDRTKEDLEGKDRTIKELNDVLSKIVDKARNKREEDKRIIEILKKDKKEMQSLIRYWTDRCYLGLCDGEKQHLSLTSISSVETGEEDHTDIVI